MYPHARLRAARLSALVFALVFVFLYALLCPAAARAQAAPPACAAADLELTVRAANDPPGTYTLAILARNASKHACTLSGYDVPAFTTTAPGPEVALCVDCDRRSQPGAAGPVLLEPGEVAHETYRWAARPAGGGVSPVSAPACQQPRWLSTQSSTTHAHTLFLVAPSLLPPICSQVDVEGYARGLVLEPDDTAPADPVPALRLSSSKDFLAMGELLTVQAESGEPPPAGHGPMQRIRGPRSCPAFLLRQRAQDGYTRIDELRPPRIVCTVESNAGSVTPHITTTLDTLAHLRALDIGDNEVQLLQVVSAAGAGRVELAESNVLPLRVVDPATLPRRWGPTERGVRVDLSLDKYTFALGEDIPLHIAAQVTASAGGAIYGEPYMRRAEDLSTAAAAFHLAITSADGPEPGADVPANLFRAVPGAAMGAAACPEPMPVGKVVPLERSLKLYDLLPHVPGTYKLMVMWTPYTTRARSCDGATAELSDPWVTVQSNAVTIRITGGPSTAEEIATQPEYRGWEANFTVSDTPLGKRTGLIDRETHLEWLKLSVTANRSQEWIGRMMGKGRPLEGWRFATLDEVVKMFTHFTNTTDGTSRDVQVERALQDALGGPLAHPTYNLGAVKMQQTRGNVAGFFAPDDTAARPASAPRFQYHFAMIEETLREGQITAIVNPRAVGWSDGDRTSPNAGTFLVRAH